MFERIKAYKKLNENNKFLKGCKIIAEMTDDKNMLKEINEALYLNELIKRKMWLDRKMAIDYNLESIRRGL